MTMYEKEQANWKKIVISMIVIKQCQSKPAAKEETLCSFQCISEGISCDKRGVFSIFGECRGTWGSNVVLYHRFVWLHFLCCWNCFCLSKQRESPNLASGPVLFLWTPLITKGLKQISSLYFPKSGLYVPFLFQEQVLKDWFSGSNLQMA